MPISNRLLDNGITLISEPVAATKAAAIGFWFYTGSRDETNRQSGIAHFIEHMLFKGTGSRSARDIARFFDRTGGYVNAYTERETVCLYAVVPASCLVAASSVMLDMITDSVFSDADVETERTVIESEILSYLDDPEESCAEWFMETSFSGTGLSQPIAGTVKSIRELSAETLREYHRVAFAPRLACVTLSGAVDADAICGEIARYPFRYDPASNPSGKDAPPIWVPGLRAKKTDFNQSQLFAGWRIPEVKTAEDWFSWSAINDILSDTVSSRLFQELREERGLCYSISGSVNAFRDVSFLGVSLSVPPEKTDEASAALFEITGLFFADGPAEGEVSDARERDAGTITLASEDPEYRMKRLASQFFRGGDVRPVEDDLLIVQSLTLDALRLKATSIRHAEDRSAVLLAPGRHGRLFLRSR